MAWHNVWSWYSLQYLQCKRGEKMALPMCSLSFLTFLFGRFVDPRSIETQTNPIDRSIALLLFHQSSDHAVVAVDDASSLKSPVGVWFPRLLHRTNQSAVIALCASITRLLPPCRTNNTRALLLTKPLCQLHRCIPQEVRRPPRMYNPWTSTEFMALLSMTLLKRHDVELSTSVIFRCNIVTDVWGAFTWCF